MVNEVLLGLSHTYYFLVSDVETLNIKYNSTSGVIEGKNKDQETSWLRDVWTSKCGMFRKTVCWHGLYMRFNDIRVVWILRIGMF